MTQDIIAIGGSAGSHTGLKNVVRQLPHSLPAAVFVDPSDATCRQCSSRFA
jgi:chemotaxis response regulator CheB